MRIVLLRHGATKGNEERRYVGKRTDEPLSDLGRDQCLRLRSTLRINPGVVYASPLLRARQTAALCFPDARIEPVAGLEEMDFGRFEGKTAQEMERDGDYRLWVESGCASRCPGGESLPAYATRSNASLLRLIRSKGAEEQVVVVAHGGTIMAALDAFARTSERRPLFSWHVENCGGIQAAARLAPGGLELYHIQRYPPAR